MFEYKKNNEVIINENTVLEIDFFNKLEPSFKISDDVEYLIYNPKTKTIFIIYTDGSEKFITSQWIEGDKYIENEIYYIKYLNSV